MSRATTAVVLSLLAGVAPAADVPADQGEFFENRIRPVLIESCYRCHSTESGKSKGGLLLDSKAGVLKGGDSGPTLVPGKPDESLLIKAIRFTDKELQMPPESAGGKLSPEKIADLEAWVAMGAPDPRDGVAAKPSTASESPATAVEHWAFKRVVRPAIPAVKDTNWVRTPLDAFVLARLEAKDLRPSPPADRRTLLRRVSFDLTGLPPSAAEVEAFVRDTAGDAYERVVERLLASPRYGERWGRYWLDVARYADTKGYVFQEERRYAFSYTYRDYVIAAFNQDKPFDQFLVEQIAADRLTPGTAASLPPSSPASSPLQIGSDRSSLAALGFLTLGRRFLNQQNDIIDDRIDVVMRGTQGLTVACARCHDHKFDPISMKDYYALHGVFASSREPDEKPLLGGPTDPAQHEAFLKARAEIEARREAVIEDEVQKWLTEQRNKAADYRAAAEAALTLPADASLETFAGERKVALEVLRQWIALAKTSAATNDPASAGVAPPDLSGAEVRRIIARHLDNQTVKHRQDLAALDWQHPGAPARAMAMEDSPRAHNSRVFIRGNPGNPGAEVPRRFVEVLAGPEPPLFTDGSGRLELARAIASRDNPLTARVFANRVWGWRFGAPLVRTPSDFGVRTEAPEHRELLDWLAATFMEEGWSVKKLHRAMLLSNTYQQASGAADVATAARSAAEVDPENTLLWRQNRRRLDFEAMRDALLAVSGRLDPAMGGQPADLLAEPFTGRRTVYGLIDRQNLPGVFRTFDFANPDASSPGRFTTTVPQQALFMMNSPFVIELARRLAATAAAGAPSPADALRALFTRLLQRPPEPAEAELGTAFLARATAQPAPVADGWQYGLGRYDESANTITGFIEMSARAAGRVSPATQFPLPDDRGYASLTATGGHPGNSAQSAVIRRWVAPADGVVRIEGTLQHGNAQGDGVRGRLVQPGAGRVAEWRAFNSAQPTVVTDLTVRRGDTLDFVVDGLDGPSFDSFNWAPTIRLQPKDEGAVARTAWAAADDFATDQREQPPLTPLEQLAQVLLLSNEFAFVD